MLIVTLVATNTNHPSDLLFTVCVFCACGRWSRVPPRCAGLLQSPAYPCAGEGRFGRSMSAGDALEHARSEAAIAIVCFTRLGCSTHNKADCCAAH